MEKVTSKKISVTVSLLGFILMTWFIIGFIMLDFNLLNWGSGQRALLIIITGVYFLLKHELKELIANND